MHCWLSADPTANFAMINMGGIRQDLPTGAFTKEDVISFLPFDDKVYRIQMTGQQLMNLHGPKGEIVGASGLKVTDGKLCWSRIDQPIDEKTTYRILVNDYLYNNCEAMKQADPAPATVFTDWRIPVYRWLADHKTSAQRPVEKEITLDRIIRFGEEGLVTGP